MLPEIQIKKCDRITLSEASNLVGYSRDYIGSLARQKKIISEQIDNRWFVSRESLLNFFEISKIEDSVKKRILSLSRKNDLEVKAFYIKTCSEIYKREIFNNTLSLLMTAVILTGGIVGGMALHLGLVTSPVAPVASLTQALNAEKFSVNEVASVPSGFVGGVFFPGLTVDDTVDKISIENGVLLLPAVATVESIEVENFFSDEVAVIVTGTSTGLVRVKGSDTELPFVRIPVSTQ